MSRPLANRTDDTPVWQAVRRLKLQRKFICDKTGIEFWRLSRIFCGSQPTESEAIALARVIGVDVGEIFDEKTSYSHRAIEQGALQQ